MPAPYSMDLRKKIILAYENGEGSVATVAKRFKVALSTVVSYLKRKRETGDVKPIVGKPAKKAIIDTKGRSVIRWWVERKPDIILYELCEKYQKRFKVKVSLSMMCRALQQMNLRRKKKSTYALEQEREDIKKKRNV